MPASEAKPDAMPGVCHQQYAALMPRRHSRRGSVVVTILRDGADRYLSERFWTEGEDAPHPQTEAHLEAHNGRHIQSFHGLLGVALLLLCVYGGYGIFRTTRVGQTGKTRNLVLSQIRLLPFALCLPYVSWQHLSTRQAMPLLPLAMLPGAAISLLQLLGMIKFSYNDVEVNQ